MLFKKNANSLAHVGRYSSPPQKTVTYQPALSGTFRDVIYVYSKVILSRGCHVLLVLSYAKTNYKCYLICSTCLCK